MLKLNRSVPTVSFSSATWMNEFYIVSKEIFFSFDALSINAN